MALLPFIMKIICHMKNTIVSHAVMASAIAAVSKYHISDNDFGVNIGRHPVVTTTIKYFWQQKYHGTYDVRIILRIIENLGENKAFLVEVLFGVQG